MDLALPITVIYWMGGLKPDSITCLLSLFVVLFNALVLRSLGLTIGAVVVEIPIFIYKLLFGVQFEEEDVHGCSRGVMCKVVDYTAIRPIAYSASSETEVEKKEFTISRKLEENGTTNEVNYLATKKS
ncbi:uncharacterized protein A4U43_C10F2670 [Asparagus officinalis]|uniref:Uncharacterized protein n=1 Tax=Asparagus officinalis TaxID=4686 RepID=A0A5P1E4K1_ASPOF|nr:uncharacterized protein A4U43_C10F2670 [Asparagus officinalis]